MDSNDTDSPGTQDTSRTRKRKRETPEERRVKCRLRKRRKRADLPPLARRVQANSSSSSGEGFAAEIERNPGGRIYLFNEAAHNRLQEQVVAAGRPLHIQRREFTSALPQEVSGSNPDSDGDVDGQGPPVQLIQNGNKTDSSQNLADNAAVGQEDLVEQDQGAQEAEEAVNTSGEGQSHENNNETVRNQREISDFNMENERIVEAVENNAENLEENTENLHGNCEREEALMRREMENVSDMEKLAIAMAGVRGSSNASNSALDKTFRVVFQHMDSVRILRRKRNRKKVFSKCLRRLAGKFIPSVVTDLLLEERTEEGTVEYKRVEGLTAIPDEYRRLSSTSSLRVIREESSVSLRDIKKHHERVHLKKGMSLGEIRKQYGNCVLSLDGVEESKSGLKKFHMASIKIGDCIYPYKVFDLMIGHEAAKVKTETLIG